MKVMSIPQRGLLRWVHKETSQLGFHLPLVCPNLETRATTRAYVYASANYTATITSGGEELSSGFQIVSDGGRSFTLPITYRVLIQPFVKGTTDCLVLDSEMAEDNSHGVNTGALVGGIVGGILGLCLLVGIFLFYRRRSQQKRNAERKIFADSVATGPYKFQNTDPPRKDADIPLSPLSAEANK